MSQLEAGSNIFELIEFELERDLGKGRFLVGHYGVNVAKVREVIRIPKIDPLASSVNGIVGLMSLRGVPIPVVSLNVVLGDERGEDPQPTHIIVAEFSQRRAGFLVRNTKSIRRVSWDKVLAPSTDSGSCITGMILLEENSFIYILDLEKIIYELEWKAEGFNVAEASARSPFSTSIPNSETKDYSVRSANGKHVLVVDDSKLVVSNLKKTLEKEGYLVSVCFNGVEALKLMNKSLSDSGVAKVDVVISDVEMPAMDGLSFTREIKKHHILKSIPVILHTSLGAKGSIEAGQKVGADAYVVKNDLASLLQTLGKVVFGQRKSGAA